MISIAFSLLLAASSLILQVQNNANVSDALKYQVYAIATQAVTYAEETLTLNGATIDTTATTTDAISLPAITSTPPQTVQVQNPVVVNPPVVNPPVVSTPTPLPPAPTCTISDEGVQTKQVPDGTGGFQTQYTVYIDHTMTGEQTTATINGISTNTFPSPFFLKHGGDNEFDMVVTDDKGQTGTCQDVITIPL